MSTNYFLTFVFGALVAGVVLMPLALRYVKPLVSPLYEGGL
jgi:hypothetical protein